MTASIRNGNDDGYYAHINPDFLATFWSYFDEHFRSVVLLHMRLSTSRGPLHLSAVLIMFACTTAIAFDRDARRSAPRHDIRYCWIHYIDQLFAVV